MTSKQANQFFTMAREMERKHSDDFTLFIATFKIEEMFDKRGNIFYEKIPYLLIDKRDY